MQIKSLRVKSYRSWRIDDNTSAEALGRLKQLEWVERLRGEGVVRRPLWQWWLVEGNILPLVETLP